MWKPAGVYIIGALSIATLAYAQSAEVSPNEKLLNDRIRGSRWNSYAITRPASEHGLYTLSSFDGRRVERLANGRYKVWVRTDFSSTQTWTTYGATHEYDWGIAQQEVNCRTLETLSLRRLLYKDNGDGTASPTWDWTAQTKADLRWESMVPDSDGEASLKLLCRGIKNSVR